MKALLLSAAIVAACTCTGLARAGNLVDVTVIDRDTSAALPTYRHDGKLYIAGTPGHRYAVHMTNRTGARVLTVLSVDGVNAVSGETASAQQTGYVLDPYQSLEVDGWRKSLSEIAQFNFTALSNSYAARTGRPNNVGVIGVAVFREKQHPIELEQRERLSRAAPPPPSANAAPMPSDTARADAAPAGAAAPAAKSSAPATAAAESSGMSADRMPQRPAPKQESLGTGHGAREASYASYTQFERESSSPNEVDSIWYDSFANLADRGIVPRPRPLAADPQPFPNGFVPDPGN